VRGENQFILVSESEKWMDWSWGNSPFSPFRNAFPSYKISCIRQEPFSSSFSQVLFLSCKKEKHDAWENTGAGLFFEFLFNGKIPLPKLLGL
jgi:hypothetical protein